MSRVKWLILVLAFVLQFMLASSPAFGVIWQPLVVVIVVFANYLSARQIMVVAGLAGILSELLSSGSAGEVLATYLVFGLVISAIKYFSPQHLEIPRTLFVLLLVFSSIFGIVSLLPLKILTPTMLGILISEMLVFFVISALLMWLLAKSFTGYDYE